ncbi:MAG: ATP-binding cassette domain-containing protein, partial [Deltaproteobacteria bacterium]|nr:ATP-binding cassette domain-containing protein [Deltaproteobacteria bacterium]
MADEILALDDVVKTLHGYRVLDGLTFSVKEGERVALIGESTAGKTTVFKVIVGLLRLDSGRVSIFGQDTTGMNEAARRAILRDIEMQFQFGALFDSMTVGENVRFVLDEEKKLSRKEKEERVELLLRELNLWAAVNKYPYQLSGGMKKRAAVARALSTSPRLALFDEPAAGLDPVSSIRLVSTIKALVPESHTTVIIATTSALQAHRFADRIILLKAGC